MDKERILSDVLTIENKNIILEFATGTGKTLCAIKLFERTLNRCNHERKILIVIPKLALIKEWIKEFNKWGMSDILPYVEFSTYVSFPKNYDKNWVMVCFDEAHHITGRCFQAIYSSVNRRSINHIFLSATLSEYFKNKLSFAFPDIVNKKINLKEAIEGGILPDPTILLYPMMLDNSEQRLTYIKRASKRPVTVSYQQRWSVLKNQDVSPHILCTERQYYNLLDEDIKFLESNSKFKSTLSLKKIKRLKLLSDFKTEKIKPILSILKDYRTITFCNSIEQCEQLGKFCIHSQNEYRMEYLDDFNNKKINHITSCDMLSEGVNITDCNIGIFARINASETQIYQRIGRILRHKHPVIILPYYMYTREEEIIKGEILPIFNPDKIFTITGINEILKYLK